MVTKWCVIEGGFVTNVVLWDGNTATWTPPAGSTVVPYDPALPVKPLDITVQNLATIQQRAQTALAANATYQAITNPTTAQAVAQVALLTKECNGLIKLALGLTADTVGT